MQKQYLRSIIIKVFLSLIFLATLAFASNEAGANFVYEYGKMYEADFSSQNINFNAKALIQNQVVFNWNTTSIESDGGEIVFLSLSFPFSTNLCVLEPSIMFGNGAWKRGDFQYFYGKPDLPQVLGFEMSLYKGSSNIGLLYFLGNAKLLNNNENIELFNSDFYIYNALYQYRINKGINLAAGFMGLNVEASGMLTAENQGYFLFPYAFYNASGHLEAKAVYALANLKLESASAEYGLDFGALAVLSGKLAGNMHYKYRKFFGKEEFIETLTPVQMKNSGIIFSILSIKTKKINIGSNYIQYGVQKPFALPFGAAFPESFGNSNLGRDISLKDIFLFGLTASLNVYF
jgi:hypothetical protein